MKTPRIEDFDPNAISALKSPMDNLPSIEKPAQKNTGHTPVRPNGSTPAREPVKASIRTPERRFITRYSYELYMDQAEALKRFSLEDQMEGKKGSMSEMVREAIDAYIAKRKNSR